MDIIKLKEISILFKMKLKILKRMNYKKKNDLDQMKNILNINFPIFPGFANNLRVLSPERNTN